MPTCRSVLQGLAALIPGLAVSGLAAPPASAFPPGQRFICTEPGCLSYIDDPVEGDPRTGIPPGTPFADIPEDWRCPICGVSKSGFIPFG
ncbi:MAG: hypothetical protein GVY13_10585 [Alphaproteobacteria bacterium]|jgi:rubredoxin|nr:hypothetical protein [Alphaproteobacteria bacterium]